jgi:hypothetical protein
VYGAIGIDYKSPLVVVEGIIFTSRMGLLVILPELQ